MNTKQRHHRARIDLRICAVRIELILTGIDGQTTCIQRTTCAEHRIWTTAARYAADAQTLYQHMGTECSLSTWFTLEPADYHTPQLYEEL